jgi:hypothetical protein
MIVGVGNGLIGGPFLGVAFRKFHARDFPLLDTGVSREARTDR